MNCRAKIRPFAILPAARVHLNRHGAISRAFDTLLNSISLTPDPAHRRRTFCLDGWISTWKCIFGPFCARLVPSFGSWNLRRCSVCRRQRRPASSLCGSTRRRRLCVTAAARWKRIVEGLARRQRCIWRMLCRRSLSQRPGFASWRSGGMTWLQGTGDDSAVDRALGCLQARPCGSWADATDHCFGAAAAKPCPLRCGAGPRPSRDLVAAADGRLLQRPQRPQRTARGWFGGLLLLPVSGRGRRHNVDSPGHVSASDGARMLWVDSCCATEGAEGSRRKPVTLHRHAPFHLSVFCPK